MKELISMRSHIIRQNSSWIRFLVLMALSATLLCTRTSFSQLVSMDIPASPLWSSTGISLTNGEIVSITATGSWVWGGADSGPFGPAGDFNNTSDTFFSGAFHGGLIAYVGADP